MRWRIYYGDGLTYDGNSFYAPPLNVQLIIQESDNKRGFILIHGQPYYCWDKDMGWDGKDEPGKHDYLMHTDGPVKVLYGRTIYDQIYQDICRRAVEEGLL